MIVHVCGIIVSWFFGFHKRLWEKLFSTDVGEVIYEHVLTQVGSVGIYVRN